MGEREGGERRSERARAIGRERLRERASDWSYAVFRPKNPDGSALPGGALCRGERYAGGSAMPQVSPLSGGGGYSYFAGELPGNGDLQIREDFTAPLRGNTASHLLSREAGQASRGIFF